MALEEILERYYLSITLSEQKNETYESEKSNNNFQIWKMVVKDVVGILCCILVYACVIYADFAFIAHLLLRGIRIFGLVLELNRQFKL